MVTSEMLLSGLASGVLTGGLYGLLAISFILIYKASGVLNFAQGEMVMVGAYIIFFALAQLHLPVLLGLLVGIVLAGLFGWAIHETALRPLIGQPVFSMMMITIALSLFFRGITPVIWGNAILPAPELIPLKTLSLGTVKFSLVGLVSFACAAIAAIGFTVFFKFTRRGLLMRAVCEDHQLAEATGISVRRILNQIWILSAIVAMVGGVLVSQTTGVGDTAANMAMKALPVALLVGLESIPGALLGGVIIGVSEIIACLYLDSFTRGGMMETFPFILMLLVLIIRPYGLFGLKRIERV
ncbi:MAG: branched-chain amino acid ABC transporter permease [Dehalococcoidia bacterium]|nr:branched-chain amino acid ABC transporter permease [Dehalococcoidia bacterium]